MSGSVYAIAAVVLAAGAASARSDDPKAPASPPVVVTAAAAPDAKQEPHAATQTSATHTDTLPKIVVHENAAPTQMGDGRVRVGGMKISMSPWASGTTDATTGSTAASSSSSSSSSSSVTSTTGAIAVPSNTLGPGEPYWRIGERADAEHRLADARIEHAQAEAERATRQAGRDHGYIFFGNSYLTGGWRGGYGSGLRGPVTTTTTYSDQLGATAQRNFSEAAYPRLNGTTDARDAIVRQFGRDAVPPVVQTQNAVDAIHRRANSETRK